MHTKKDQSSVCLLHVAKGTVQGSQAKENFKTIATLLWPNTAEETCGLPPYSPQQRLSSEPNLHTHGVVKCASQAPD